MTPLSLGLAFLMVAAPAIAAAEVPAPRDVAYPGTIRLAVDATDLDRKVFTVHETVPISGPGPMILLYPQWLPGNHSPTGKIEDLGGLVIHAGGQRLDWTRDPVNVFAFKVTVPGGVKTLDLDFQFLSPVDRDEGSIVMTPDLLRLQWDAVVLYPAGYYSRQIMVAASVKLPQGFRYADALEPVSASGPDIAFQPVGLNKLVDSPLLAGRYSRVIDLDPGGPAPVKLDLFADRPSLLAATEPQIAAHRALVQQAYRLFGSHHYAHYDFLVSLSDQLGGIGLEHHQSSEDQATPKYFTDWDKTQAGRDLLAHEYTHSWNGKFRRPADLWTPNFNVPMGDSLLWVYEGQTQYWGYVLAARSGLMSKQDALDAIAQVAAVYGDARPGRTWRDLEDTTNDPVIAMRQPIPWRSWQRSEDYYSEGQLIWLDADTLIREKTNGARSLDDFAKAFFGVSGDGRNPTLTYDFDDVVAALNGVLPYDWKGFLEQRLYSHAPAAPLDGLARGGYRLAFTDTPSDYQKSEDMGRKSTDLLFSLGFTIGKDGALSEVLWGGPAFKAGLTVGAELVAINGEAYDADDLKDAVKAASAPGSGPIQLLVKENRRYRTVSIDYHNGLRYPHLVRIDGAPARLDDILTPKR